MIFHHDEPFSELRSVYGQYFVKWQRSLENTERNISVNGIMLRLLCQDENITPPSLRLKCHVYTNEARDSLSRVRKGLPREQLRISNNNLTKLIKRKEELDFLVPQKGHFFYNIWQKRN